MPPVKSRAISIKARDLLLMVGRKGEAGRTVLRYASAPQVTVNGSVESHFDAARGDLVLDYTHGALASVEISGGGRPPLTLLLGDDAVGASCWNADGVLACGPNLVRHAVAKGGALALTGDTIAAGPLRVWGEASRVTWNGAPVAMKAQDGALVGACPVRRRWLCRSSPGAAWRVLPRPRPVSTTATGRPSTTAATPPSRKSPMASPP
jgi:hypothetical protein